MDEQKVAQLQMIEQNLQNLLSQKQVFQSQLVEIESAIEEVTKTESNVYKILGTIMVISKREDVLKDLKSKKEVIDIRLKSIDKQESQLKEKSESLQEEAIGKNGRHN